MTRADDDRGGRAKRSIGTEGEKLQPKSYSPLLIPSEMSRD
ncbi:MULTISPECIES: hypothetical protein [unclassified Microcoleus]